MSGVVTVVGGGLSGCECAWQLARRGHLVRLVEMRPSRTTEAHATGDLAELVCSNSFRSDNPENAVGLLKREMALLGSIVLEAARGAAVPAGDALAVDRALFSRRIEEALLSTGRVEIVREEVTEIPPPDQAETVVIATGPLTSEPLARAIEQLLGEDSLYFYDSIAPIVVGESLDHGVVYRLSRYGKGAGDEYLNVPLGREAYERFVSELLRAETFPVRDFEARLFFEGCLPIEVMAARGTETLRHGPMKPFGLPDPRTREEPWAVVQLRQDDLSAEHWNMVGFQTKLVASEQKRLFRTLPGLANAEFARLGSMHRNTFVNGPRHLDNYYRLKREPRIRFAGQLTGVEGYLESAASGLAAGLFTALEREVGAGLGSAALGAVATDLSAAAGSAPPHAHPAESLPWTTAIGGLVRHVSARSPDGYQPSNVNFSLVDTSGLKGPKRERRARIVERALADLRAWMDRVLGASPVR